MARKALREIYCWQIESDELRIYLASSKKGAVRVGISLDRDADCLTYFRSLFPSHGVFENRPMNRALLKAVEAALVNAQGPKHLSLDINGTPFQLRVWKGIAQIPFGKTRTYGEVAQMVGRAGGARAVGQALGRNPLPLIFP